MISNVEAVGQFVLGSQESEHVSVQIFRPSNPRHWGGSWVSGTITVRAGGFSGTITANLQAEDFVLFRDAVRRVHAELRGEAVFMTMEDQLELQLIGDGVGPLEIEGKVSDRAGWTGNTLTFHLSCDQSDLPPLLRDLDGLVAAFSVVGKPDDP
jgi:hypothetical protein